MGYNLNYYNLGDYELLLQNKAIVTSKKISSDSLETNIKYISFNSRDIREGTLFVCKGAHFDVKYLMDALRNGACAYVSESKYELGAEFDDIPYIIVDDIRIAMAEIANKYYNHIWDKLNLIGITGTKGKSSTAYFVKYILDEYEHYKDGHETAIVSGIDNYDGVINEESHLTTPEAFDLQRHIYNAVSSGIEYLTMEVSSQALKYDRVRDVIYDIGCFLNIGQDHISGVEHSDMNDYLNSKLILFSQCKKAIINLGTDNKDRVIAAALDAQKTDNLTGVGAPEIVTFGFEDEASYYGYDIDTVSDASGISFSVKSSSFHEQFKIGMRGLFNVENALAAIAMTSELGIPVEIIKSGLLKARVSGRMEIYTSKRRGINVIVDYAHNQMSFESLFTSMKKEYPGKKISIVFGCPGKKALGRRKELGEIAGKYSNHVYITEEDAGEEPVNKICKEIAEHVEAQNCPYNIVEDRREAIRQAIDTADEDTIVLITGKGRETRQKRGTQYIDTPSDVEYVESFLRDK